MQQAGEIAGGIVLSPGQRNGVQLLRAFAQRGVGLLGQGGALHSDGQLAGDRGGQLNIAAGKVFRSMTGKHQFAHAAPAKNQWHIDHRAHVQRLNQHAVWGQDALIGLRIPRNESALAVGHHQRSKALIHRDPPQAIAQFLRNAVNRGAVSAQLVFLRVQEEHRGRIHFEQAGKFNQREFEDLVQAGLGTRQAGDATQRLGAQSPANGLLQQVSVLNDRRGLPGDDRKQADIIRRESCAIALVGCLQITQRATAAFQRDQHGMVNACRARRRRQPQIDQVRIFRRVLSDNDLLRTPDALCRAIGQDFHLIKFNKIGRYTKEGRLRGQPVRHIIEEQETGHLHIEQRGNPLRQLSKQFLRIAHRTDGLRQISQACQLKGAALFLAIHQRVMQRNGGLPRKQSQDLHVVVAIRIRLQRGQVQRTDQLTTHEQGDAQVGAEGIFAAINQRAELAVGIHIGDQNGLSTGSDIARIPLTDGIALIGELQSSVHTGHAHKTIRDQVLILGIPDGDLSKIGGDEALHAVEDGMQRGFQVQVGGHRLAQRGEYLHGLWRGLCPALPEAGDLVRAHGNQDGIPAAIGEEKRRPLDQFAPHRKLCHALGCAQRDEGFARPSLARDPFKRRSFLPNAEQLAGCAVHICNPSPRAQDHHGILVCRQIRLHREKCILAGNRQTAGNQTRGQYRQGKEEQPDEKHRHAQRYRAQINHHCIKSSGEAHPAVRRASAAISVISRISANW